MDSGEVAAEVSLASGQDSLVGVSSVGSYNEHTAAQNDNASIGASSQVPQSPPRSTPSVPSSPTSVGHQAQAGEGVSSTPHATYDAALLGVQRLEQQAVDMGWQFNTDPALNQPYTPNRVPSGQGVGSSDDEHTEPSSTATGNASGENPAGYTRSDLNTLATSTFGRAVKGSKRRAATGDRKPSDSPEEDDEDDDLLESALIFGYLQKLGRNGKWQTRWFESDGECLTYYKSSKRSTLLATLDLAKVGSIVINHEDEKGTCFTINISERPYHLRADSKAACKDWVITLNRVKEARMHEGNVKLVMPGSNQPPDLLDQNFAPRVVVVANRQRTRAVDDEEIHSWEQGFNNNPASEDENFVSPPSSRLARWQKPRTSLFRFATKVLKWARSIRKFSCADVENNVILDHHLHPPGHDDMPKLSASTSPAASKGRGKDPMAELGGASANTIDSDSAAQSLEPEEDDGIRHLS